MSVRALAVFTFVCVASAGLLPGCTDTGRVGMASACGNGSGCAGGRVCDPMLAICVECVSDRDCSARDAAQRPFCATMSHACIECRDAADCMNGAACTNGACVDHQPGSDDTAGTGAAGQSDDNRSRGAAGDTHSGEN